MSSIAHARLHLVYSVNDLSDEPLPYDAGAEATEHLELSGSEQLMRDARSWSLRFLSHDRWDPKDLELGPSNGHSIELHSVAAALWLLPHAGFAVGLDLDVSIDRGGAIQLLDLTYFHDRPLTIGGRPVLTALAEGLPDALARRVGDAQLGWDRRQILVVDDTDFLGPPGDVPGAGLVDVSRAHVVGLDLAFVTQLMAKEHDPHRPAMTPVRIPPYLNGPEGSQAVVLGSNTLISGLPEYQVNQLLLSSVQVVCATSAARDIRARAHAAFRELERSRETTFDDPMELRKVARELAELQMRLSLGVEMHVGTALVGGGRPVMHYHRTIVEQVWLEDGLDATSKMLDRLHNYLEAEHQALAFREMLAAEVAQSKLLESVRALITTTDSARSAGIVAAVSAAILTATGLFAALAAIPSAGGSEALLLPPLVAALVAMTIVIGALGYGYLTYVAVRFRCPAPLARRLQVGLRATVGGALILLAVSAVVGPMVLLLVAAGGLLGAGVLLFAAQRTF